MSDWIDPGMQRIERGECPFCGDKNAQLSDGAWRDGKYSVFGICHTCRKEWRSEYSLSNFVVKEEQ